MFRKLITFEEAKKAVNLNIRSFSIGIEEVSILEACDHILATDVKSNLDIPPFDRSIVDGFAVRAEDTFGADEKNPIKMKRIGNVNVGEPPKVVMEKGETAEIVTGAPIPEGADAVVMVEDTEKKNSEIRFYASVTKNENIMKKGTDIKRGEIVLEGKQVLGSREIGVLGALGMKNVKVFIRPKVAVLSTGAEIIEPGRPLSPGKIYDINGYSLSAAVKESGGNPVYAGVVSDDRAELRKALEKALASADMVVTSGGVSVGPKDIIPETVDALGKPGIIFSGIAVKPGKPATFAMIGRKPVFSFPGHPTSALLMFHLLARPFIQQMSAILPRKANTAKAIAGIRMFSARGRRTFVMVKLRSDGQGRIVAEPVETGASGAITTLAKADGFLEIPENQQFVDINETVTVTLFKDAT
jgi:molybdenum cofactor synthesis domain-containing protein